jgi:hypothetical protein
MTRARQAEGRSKWNFDGSPAGIGDPPQPAIGAVDEESAVGRPAYSCRGHVELPRYLSLRGTPRAHPEPNHPGGVGREEGNGMSVARPGCRDRLLASDDRRRGWGEIRILFDHLHGATAIQVQRPETESAASFALEEHPPSIGQERGIKVLSGIACRVRQRAGESSIGWQEPQLSQQVEDQRPAVRREVEAKVGSLVHGELERLSIGGAGSSARDAQQDAQETDEARQHVPSWQHDAVREAIPIR